MIFLNCYKKAEKKYYAFLSLNAKNSKLLSKYYIFLKIKLLIIVIDQYFLTRNKLFAYKLIISGNWFDKSTLSNLYLFEQDTNYFL